VAASLPLVGEELAGYRLRAVIGRGGMSVVFQAENPRLSSIVALKVLAPELSANDTFRARFLQESRIAAGLSHPNVIPIFDMGTHEELLFIAMRYVAGADLRAILQVRGRLLPEQSLSLIRQAGQALDAAHRSDLIHRDVKPANLLVERGVEDDPDHVYLADFGLTKHELSRSGLTATGEFVGTLAYIAPEQIKGEQVDGRADIYSLGCILYESLTGRVPFLKDADAAIIWAHVEEQPVAPSAVCADLPEAFDKVIVRALAKRPEDRYASCREFVDAASAAFRPSVKPATRTSGGNPESVLARTPPFPLSDRTEVERPAAHVDHTEVDPPVPSPHATETDLAAGSSDPAPGIQDESAGRAAATGAQPSERDVGIFPPPMAAHGDSSRASTKTGPRRHRWLVAAAVLAVAAVAVVALVLSSGTSSAGQTDGAALAAVPDNHVNGSGTVSLNLTGDVATVKVDTRGLLNGEPHLMHIHAGGKGACPPASAARLHNGHLAISTGNGIGYYGQTVATLSTYGSTSGIPPNNVQFPAAPMTGGITYHRKIVLTKDAARLIRLGDAVIVVHGIDYNGNHRYDDVLGLSDLDKVYSGESTAPALCGPLRRQSSADVARAGSGTQVYAATLGVARGSAAERIAAGLALLCHLAPVPRLPAQAPSPHSAPSIA
jgi:serine/threonine protein kinase